MPPGPIQSEPSQRQCLIRAGRSIPERTPPSLNTLPPELRIMIWRFAAMNDEPRLIRVKLLNRRPPQPAVRMDAGPVPALLHVNSESRYEMQKFVYKKAYDFFEDYIGHEYAPKELTDRYTYVNVAKDTFYYDPWFFGSLNDHYVYYLSYHLNRGVKCTPNQDPSPSSSVSELQSGENSADGVSEIESGEDSLSSSVSELEFGDDPSDSISELESGEDFPDDGSQLESGDNIAYEVPRVKEDKSNRICIRHAAIPSRGLEEENFDEMDPKDPLFQVAMANPDLKTLKLVLDRSHFFTLRINRKPAPGPDKYSFLDMSPTTDVSYLPGGKAKNEPIRDKLYVRESIGFKPMEEAKSDDPYYWNECENFRYDYPSWKEPRLEMAVIAYAGDDSDLPEEPEPLPRGIKEDSPEDELEE
jgi:hypothetical protein